MTYILQNKTVAAYRKTEIKELVDLHDFHNLDSRISIALSSIQSPLEE